MWFPHYCRRQTMLQVSRKRNKKKILLLLLSPLGRNTAAPGPCVCVCMSRYPRRGFKFHGWPLTIFSFFIFRFISKSNNKQPKRRRKIFAPKKIKEKKKRK
jgi:hypothetical protein